VQPLTDGLIGQVSSRSAGASDALFHSAFDHSPNGVGVVARVQTELVRDEAGEPLYFVSHIQAMTERRAARDLLHESERTLRSRRSPRASRTRPRWKSFTGSVSTTRRATG
jgi:hypothetical protein